MTQEQLEAGRERAFDLANEQTRLGDQAVRAGNDEKAMTHRAAGYVLAGLAQILDAMRQTAAPPEA